MPPLDHFRVGDLARKTGKTVRTIHYYDEMGLLAPCQRTDGGFRLYGPDAPHRVELIDHLKDLGFSLEQVREIIQAWRESGRDEDASARLRGILERALAEARKKIASFQGMEQQIVTSLDLLARGLKVESPTAYIDSLKR